MNPNALKPICTALLAVALLSTVFTCSGRAQGLDPRKSITQYSHDVWQAEDGLPQNSVAAIVQTWDGYIWLATQEGLARFDGVRFTVFDKKNTKEIGHSDIRALHESRDGSLWIGTGGGGLARLKDGRFTTYTTKEGLSGNIVRTLCEGRDGSLWIGTDGDGLSRLKDGTFTTYTTKQGLSSNRVVSLYEDRVGNLWIGTDGAGLSRLKDGKFTTYTTNEGLPVNMVWAICESRDGSLWIGTYGGGLLRMKDGNFVAYTTKEGLSHNIVVSLYEDREGSLWIGTAGGLNRLRDGRFSAYTTKEGLSSDRVVSICEDREGSLWIGTDGGGLDRLREGKFTPFTTKEGLSNDYAWTVYGSRDGSIWIGTGGGGLNRLIEGRCSVYTTKEGLSNDAVRSICEDRQGNLWIGTYGGGLNRLSDGKFVAYTTKEGLSNDMVRAICEDREGNLWIGTNGGLNRFREGKFTIYTSQNGLPHDVVRVIYEGRDGSLWIGTSDGLCRLKDGKFSVYTTKEGLSSNYVFAVYESADGTLWIGTNGGGLNRLTVDSLGDRGGRFISYTTENGLFDDLVFQILEDGQGNLWMSCNKGIFSVSRKELDDFAQGKIKSVTSISYEVAEGIRGKECNGGSQPAGWKTGDGKLWFPTLKGAVMIDPRNIKANKLLPPVVIERVSVDKSSIEIGKKAELPPGVGELEFHYTALSFVGSERIKFRYKLEGFDNEWTEAGTRRVAFYTNIPPGDYRFRVMASNSDGIWNEAGASYEFYLTPHIYQTKLFYALCVLLLLLLGSGGYYLRIRQLVRHAQKLRTGIAERTAELVEVNRALQSEITERKQAEKKYARIIQGALDGFWISDSKGRILDVNDSYCRMLGYTREELLAMSIPDVEASEKPEETAQHVKKIFEQGYDRFTTCHRRKDGKILDIEISANYVDVGEGQLVVFIRDITERKRTEEALCESEERYRKLVETAPDVIYSLSAEDGIITTLNPAFEKITGWSRDEWLGKPFMSFVHPDDLPIAIESFQQILRGETPPTHELRILSKSGEYLVGEFISTPQIRDGKVIGELGIARDITERKRAEEALRYERNLLRTLIDNLPDAIYVKDTECRKTIANVADLRYMGRQSEAEILHKTDFDFYPADIAAAFYADDQSVIQSGKSVLNKEESFLDTEGKEHWLSTSKLPLRDEQGRIIGLVGVGREITEQKRAEEALRREKALMDALMDNIPDSIYFKDQQCRLVRINRKMMRSLNLDEMSQVIGKTDVDLYGEEFGQKTLAGDQRLMESGEPIIGLTESRQLEDGGVNWTSTTKVPLRDDSGKIVGLVGITREINELMKAQQERERERNLLRTLLDNLPDYIYIKDTEGRFVIGNIAVVRQLGFVSEDKLIGKTDFDLFPHELAARYYAYEQQIIQSGKGIYDYEGPAVDANKEEKDRWVSTTKVPLRDAQGRIIGTVGIGRDITVHKHAQEAIQRERNLLRTLIDNLPDYIYVKDTEGRFVVANIAVVRQLGFASEDKLIGKTDFDLFPHELAARYYADEQAIIQSGQGLYDYEGPSVDANKEVKDRWVSTTKVPLRDAQGKIMGFVGIGRDITERKRVEQELWRERELMNALMEHTPDNVYFKDTESRFLRMSRALAKWFGLDEPAQAIGKTDFDFFDPEHAEPARADELKIIKTGEPVVSIEEREVWPDGRVTWVSTTKVPLRDQSGQIIGTFGISRNITERKRAEEALQQERNLLRAVIDNMPDLFYFKDAEGRYVLNNLAHLQSLGVERQESVLGKTTFDFNPPELAKQYYEDEMQIVRTGEALLQREELALHKDTGEQRWHLTSKIPLKDSQGKITGVVGISRDVTERKQAEERQAQLLKEVEHANQELNDFAYVISHDLKAPLRAIGSLTNWLSTDYADRFDQHGKELIHLLFGRVKRMHDLIDGVLQYSRVGRIKEERVSVDLDELVSGVIDMLAPPANIQISVDNDLPTVVCEKTRMQQVFQNLLSNAVKFMDKRNGEIRIGCEKADGYWKFRVADNGPGIEDKHFTKIFQIFQTLSPRDEFESTGVGLTVVRKIIEMYGGKIWVESRVGDGSTFYFTLPTQGV